MSRTNNIASHHQQVHRFAVIFAAALASFILALDLFASIWLGGNAFFSASNAWFILVLISLIGSCSLYQLFRLSQNGAKVAEIMGGQPLPSHPADSKGHAYRRLATEIAQKADVNAPKLFVQINETRINAFAAGNARKGTAICVTQGALDKLTEAELEGILAHEMAHLRHEDTKLSSWLAAGTFGLLCFTMLGALITYLAAAASKDAGEGKVGVVMGGCIVGGLVMLAGSAGWLGANLLDAATSRRMESRADAEAVRILGHSEGLVDALIRIGHEANDLPDHALEALSPPNPMYFNAAFRKHWFDSHPPVLDRIRALDPERAAKLGRP